MFQAISRRQFLCGDFRNRRATAPGPSIGDTCLAHRGVVCQVCGEQCEAHAIHFSPRLQAAAVPILDTALCTACGACATVCPAQAIHIPKNTEVA